MKIIFIPPPIRLKCVVHKNGRLIFSMPACRKLDLKNNRYCKIGISERDDDNGDCLFLVVRNQDSDNECFKISATGDNYYINVKNLFNHLKIDYSNKVTYKIDPFKHEGEKIYKLTKVNTVK